MSAWEPGVALEGQQGTDGKELRAALSRAMALKVGKIGWMRGSWVKE